MWTAGVALWVVRVASRLVPRSARASWRREWEAELLTRFDELRDRSALTRGARLDLLLRAGGSIVDAIRYRDGRWTMTGLAQDLRMAARGLARRPGFTALVVATLAVGIGANTAIFGVARDVLLRPFPYPDPDAVVTVETHRTAGSVAGNVSYPNMADLADLAGSFEAVSAARWWQPALEDERGSIVVAGATVTGNFFEILGVEAGEGRFFRADEQGEGRPNQVVLERGLWIDHFGADPEVVGTDIRLSGVTYRVIGVTGADFEDPWLMDGPGAQPRIWRTVASPPSEWPRGGRSWKGMARLRAGVPIEVARAEVDGIYQGLIDQYPEQNANRVMRITPLREAIAGPSQRVLYTLLASVGLLLLVACANLANLLLGRALDRRNEMALHKALGAPGWRLLQRGLAEAGMLAVLGGGAGVALAMGLGGVARGLTAMLPRPVTGAVDGVVLLFAASVTVTTGLVFGLLPAIQAASGVAAQPGRDASRGSSLGRQGHRLRRGLVVGELAVTTALLVGSGLLVRSFQRLEAVDLGFTTEGVVGMELHGAAWGDLEPEAAQTQWDEVLASIRDRPGIEASGAIDYLPLGGNYSCDGIERADRPPPGPGEGSCAEVRVILPGALETLGVRLLRGRMLDAADAADRPLVAVIDQRMADEFWPGEDPLGHRFHVHTKVHEVVGIVADMEHFGPGGAQRPMVFLHAPQEGWNGIARGLAVVARGPDVSALPSLVREAVSEVNGSIATADPQPLASLLSRTLAAPRFRTLLMVAFSVTALLLAVLGITGVMTYSVARRTKELGVRLALGAKPDEVRGLVLGEGVRLVVLGIALGLLGAAAVSGVLQSLLFEIDARDPWVYVAVTVILSGAATVACLVPARRASRVDPVTALAAE